MGVAAWILMACAVICSSQVIAAVPVEAAPPAPPAPTPAASATPATIPTAAVEVKALFTEAGADDLLTWQITGAPKAWMSFDTGKTPVMVFTSPNGVVWKRSAYLDQDYVQGPANAKATPGVNGVLPGPGSPTYLPRGERRLLVRHTPRAMGVHHWQLLDPEGNAVAEGDLSVGPQRVPGSLGPLYKCPYNPRLLAFRDGTIFIPIGLNVAWATSADPRAEFTRYFSALHANGGNHIRLWMASWCAGLEGDKPDSYRLDSAWLLDQVLAVARAQDLRITVVLDNQADIKKGTDFPYGADYAKRLKTFIVATPSTQYQRRLRYILARWGADDRIAAWELCNEVDEADDDHDADLAWIKGAAAQLAHLDVDHRLRSVSWAGDEWDQACAVPNIDLIQIHNYVLEWVDHIGLQKIGTRDGVGMLVNNAARANAMGKPFCFAELGYQGTDVENQGNALDQQGLLLLQQTWAGFMLGGYGSGMSWWWDVYVDHDQLWSTYRGFAKIVALMNWRDKGLAPLTPNQSSALRILGWQSRSQALLWPQLRSDTWYAGLIEKKERPLLAQALRIQLGGLLPHHLFTVHYLDMRTGQEKEHRAVRSNAAGTSELIVNKSASQDTVLWVEDAAP